MKTNLISLLTAIFLFTGLQSYACTNFLITKGASTDGSTMISYAADSHVLYGELYHWPAATYPNLKFNTTTFYQVYPDTTVSFTGGNGTGAAAFAVVSGGAITKVVILNGGQNYTSPPNVSFTSASGTGGNPPTATAVLADEKVKSVTLSGSSGSGYKTFQFDGIELRNIQSAQLTAQGGSVDV